MGLVIFLIALAKTNIEGKIYFGSWFRDTARRGGGDMTAAT